MTDASETAVAYEPRIAAGARIAASDRAWCRAVLPRVSRTFALNTRILSGSMGDAVCVAYLLCRAADALEDSWTDAPEAIGRRFDRLVEAATGDAAAAASLAAEARARASGRADLELVAELPRVLRAHAALDAEDRDDVTEAVRALAGGMRRYAVRGAERGPNTPYLDTEAELKDYCWVVAGCVGVMLTRLISRRAPTPHVDLEVERFRLAPVVGEALQLTNILLDWPLDIRRGRCYLPAAWLREHQIAPSALIDPSRAAVRPLARRLDALARAALGQVPEYLATVPRAQVRYRLFCAWPALWALASLRHAWGDPEFPWGPRRPRLPRSEIRSIALRSLLAIHNGRGVRRLFESLA